MNVRIPRIVIAGTSSGVGKTTVSISIMAAFAMKGIKVQPFKVGPDYIDPGFHKLATGRISRNLDSHLIDDNSLIEIFDKACIGADIAVIEGVMGLFDGSRSGSGSTAEIARLLKAPIVLTVDASGMAESVAAIAKGFDLHDERHGIDGVILNKVGSERHIKMLSESLARSGIKIFGAIKRDETVKVKERHLGLTQATETIDVAKKIEQLASIGMKKIDLKEVESVAKTAGVLSYQQGLFSGNDTKKSALGIARDRAFSFYYEDNLDILRDLGAELIEFSPMKDKALPEGINGLYLGGGFPELFSEELSANKEMMNEIRLKSKDDMPVYAECGGLVYLSKDLVDSEGNTWPLCGVHPARARMNKKLQSLGYRSATTIEDNVLTSKGSEIRGHEFHYSSLYQPDDQKRAYKLEKDSGCEGFISNNTLASYIHLHFATEKRWAKSLVEKSVDYKERIS